MTLAIQQGIFEAPLRASFARGYQPPTQSPQLLVDAEPSPPSAPIQSQDRRWSGSAWASLRHGSGPPPLAGGSQLGGSQTGARIAYRLAPRIAMAARSYAALGQPGREVALGMEWHAARTLRFVLERRIGADQAGRDAFSIYVAGGFWRKMDGLVVEGYGQAGIVGIRSRDLFADGAIRVGRQMGAVTLGAGAWGAAQPGAERLDMGPRVAMRIGPGPISVAVEQRFRLVGDASPGSGLAVTLAADF